MIIDKQLFLSALQSLPATAVQKYSTNCIDLQASGGPSGLQALGAQIVGKTPFLRVRMGAAAAGGTTPGATFQLVCSPTPWTDVDGSGGTFTVLQSSGVLLDAALTINTSVWTVALPQDIPGRYLGLGILGQGTHSAGTFDAFITPEVRVAAFS